MITSRDNPRIKAAIRLRESAGERRKWGLFFLEGSRLCCDAIASGYVPETLFATEEAQRKYPLPIDPNAYPVSPVTNSVAQKLGDTKNPQGIFGVFRQKSDRRNAFWNPGGTYIALEGVQDPGNLGAIARTAQALGLTGLLVSGGCDIYHPKALRASMGALLRVPVLECEDLVGTLAACGLPCYAAVPDGRAVPIHEISFHEGAVLLLGNEGSGLSEEALRACAARVTIPMPGKAESLNAAAAAAILMWELMRNAECGMRNA